MTSRYRDTLFSPAVKAAQERMGSRAAQEAALADRAPEPDRLTGDEAAFISARDSFYMATNGADGWPYLQHRGGPPGFVRVLDDRTLGFADFRGNRQYISLGNLADDNRVSLFFMDYANRARLKVLGRMRVADLEAEPALASALVVGGYRGAVERGFVIAVEAFDWNCAQHITPRFTVGEVAAAVQALENRIATLEAELAAARGGAG